MSSEESWARTREWKEEKRRGFDIEIKNVLRDFSKGYECIGSGSCKENPVVIYVIGRVSNRYGSQIPLCEHHDSEDIAYDIYLEEARGEE